MQVRMDLTGTERSNMQFYEVTQWLKSNPRAVKVGLAFAISVLVISVVFFGITRIGKDKVEINVFPSNAKVEIATLGTYTAGTAHLPRGEYTYTVKAEGYEPSSGTVRTHTPGYNNIRSVLLSTKEDVTYSREERNQILAIEGMVGRDTQLWTENYRTQHPIINKLPVKDMYYSIGYLVDPDGSNFRITIHTQYASYRNRALKHLRELGEDPTTTTIVFNDFKNPLTGENK